MKRCIRLAWLCALLLTLLVPQMARAQAPAPTVLAVTVNGLRNTPAEAQAEVSKITAALVGKPFDQATLDQAVKAIDALGYFFTVTTVPPQPVEGGVNLTISVAENRIVSRIEFTGNITFTDEQLLAIITTKPGQVLNDPIALQDQRALLEAYARAGYVYTEVAAPQFTADPADETKIVLTFTIFEPTISEIRILDNRKTQSNIIRRQLTFHVGDRVNINTHRQSLTNLQGLNIFKRVDITYEPGTQPNTLIVVVRVQETSTGTASLGVTQSPTEGLTGFVSVSENNLFGTTQRLSANVRFGGETGYQFSFTNPWIDPKRTSMTVNLYNFSTLREAFFGNQNSTVEYDEKRSGGDLKFSRPIGRATRFTLGFRNATIKATEDSDSPITDPSVRTALLTSNRVISTSVGLVRDTRDSFLVPSRGAYSALQAEIAGFGGTDFMKFSGEARRYFMVKADRLARERIAQQKLPLHWIFASRLMAGTSSGMPPFLDQFFLGGSDTLRGYNQDRFPGENMVLLNNELRVPLNETLGIVAFVDAGDAWSGAFSSVFGDESFTLHYGYGLGLRILLPAVGPLRLDYGINDEGESEFTFAFGSTF